MSKFDKYGVKFSDDGKKLIKAPKKITGAYIIPDSVTTIGEYAFSDCIKLEGVTIPNSVIKIDAFAFYGCIKLNNIVIPKSVKSIGECAFGFCKKLENITISSSVKKIDNDFICSCNELKSILVDKDNSVYDSRDNCNAIINTKTNILIHGCKTTVIPNGIKGIGDWAFADCYGLINITIPDSVTTIGNGAFDCCNNLKELVIPNSVTSIGDFAFNDCKELQKIVLSNNLVCIKLGTFDGCNNLMEIRIPPSVTKIYEGWYGCSGLAKIIVDKDNPRYDSRDNCNAIIETKSNTLFLGCQSTIIPNGVKSINRHAFFSCSKLKKINIPKSIKKIGIDAFRDCIALRSITVDKENQIFDSRDNCNAIIKTKSNTLIVGCKKTVIPPNIKCIGDGAFGGCAGLKSIIIPYSVERIGNAAFSRCYKLEQIVVEANNPIYDSRDNCNAIIETKDNILITGCKKTIVPHTVSYICDFAFRGCKGLKSITIPQSVTDIDEYAFYECNSLKSITFLSNEPPTIWGGDYWEYLGQFTIFKVPADAIEKYHAADGWNKMKIVPYKNKIEAFNN